MKLTKKGEYALRAMIALAQHPEQAMTITQIAELQHIPKKFLEQILLSLKAAGLVTSKAGPRGGYLIAPSPDDRVTVGRILEAVEEPMSQNTPPPEGEGGDGATPGTVCALLEDIRAYIRRKLETVTLHELAAQSVPEDQVEALMWYI